MVSNVLIVQPEGCVCAGTLTVCLEGFEVSGDLDKNNICLFQ